MYELTVMPYISNSYYTNDPMLKGQHTTKSSLVFHIRSTASVYMRIFPHPVTNTGHPVVCVKAQNYLPRESDPDPRIGANVISPPGSCAIGGFGVSEMRLLTDGWVGKIGNNENPSS
jgi:hypothetical protein